MTKIVRALSKKRRRDEPSKAEEVPDGESVEKADIVAESTTPPPFPIRDCDRLHASKVTVDCAQTEQCIPCAFKIGCFDVALDTEFCQQVPNQRPEMCPRVSQLQKQDEQKAARPVEGTLGFKKGMSVLTIGDGDLTFSLAIARLLNGYGDSGEQKDQEINLIATSYEDEETLLKVYPDFDTTRQELEQLGVRVCYKVDATKLQETLPQDASLKFDRICWNFPCSAIAKGQDGQNQEMEFNKNLVRQFVRDARSFLKPKVGEIHMSHKTKPPYNHWKLEEVALEGCKVGDDEKDGDKSSIEIAFRCRVVLDRSLLPPYTPRKALNKKSFPCHDACIYVFDQQGGSASWSGSDSTVPVTHKLILNIRSTMFKAKQRKLAAQRQKNRNKHQRNVKR